MASKSYPVKTAPRCAVASACLQRKWRHLKTLLASRYHCSQTSHAQACRSYLRSALAPAVLSGLSWKAIKSYRGANSKQTSITEMVTITDRPACVVAVSLHIAIEAREKGRGSSSDNPKAPSIPQKINNGKAKPNILAGGFLQLLLQVLSGVHSQSVCVQDMYAPKPHRANLVIIW